MNEDDLAYPCKGCGEVSFVHGCTSSMNDDADPSYLDSRRRQGLRAWSVPPASLTFSITVVPLSSMGFGGVFFHTRICCQLVPMMQHLVSPAHNDHGMSLTVSLQLEIDGIWIAFDAIPAGPFSTPMRIYSSWAMAPSYAITVHTAVVPVAIRLRIWPSSLVTRPSVPAASVAGTANVR